MTEDHMTEDQMTHDPHANNPALTAALTSLERLYEAYGANTQRWPEAGRRLLASHENDPRVAALANDARVLDRVLDMSNIAPVADGRTGVLLDRICAAADAMPAPIPAAPVKIIAFASHARPITKEARRAGYAALAASLLLGILVGTSGAGANAVRYVSDTLSMSDDETELASSTDTVAPLDEVL